MGYALWTDTQREHVRNGSPARLLNYCSLPALGITIRRRKVQHHRHFVYRSVRVGVRGRHVFQKAHALLSVVLDVLLRTSFPGDIAPFQDPGHRFAGDMLQEYRCQLD